MLVDNRLNEFKCKFWDNKDFYIEFPIPFAKDDNDVTVIGGKNGSGKTFLLDTINKHFEDECYKNKVKQYNILYFKDDRTIKTWIPYYIISNSKSYYDMLFKVCDEFNINIEKIDIDDESNIKLKTKRSNSFKKLSHGQRAILRLFSEIWVRTKDLPTVVLIDDIELHINAEHHSMLIHKLCKLLHNNQYIITSHSYNIFGAVPSEQRLLITN